MADLVFQRVGNCIRLFSRLQADNHGHLLRWVCTHPCLSRGCAEGDGHAWKDKRRCTWPILKDSRATVVTGDWLQEESSASTQAGAHGRSRRSLSPHMLRSRLWQVRASRLDMYEVVARMIAAVCSCSSQGFPFLQLGMSRYSCCKSPVQRCGCMLTAALL